MTTLPAIVFPDAELALRGYLISRIPGPRVVTDLPGNLEQVLPAIQITRIGGPTMVPQRVEIARIDVDVYATDRDAASQLARQVQAQIVAMRGQTSGGAVVARVWVPIGASWRPDWNATVRRFGLTVELTIRPA